MSKKRITPEMVMEAYKRTKYTPIQGNFYEKNDNGNCACAIGAIYTMDTGDRDEDDAPLYADKVFGVRYSQGFISGFDEESAANTSEEDYLDGYYDGKAAWKFIQGGLMNVNS